MRYQITVVETTRKEIIVAATSEEEANAVGLVRAKNLNPVSRGPTEVSSFRIGNDNAEVT